MESGSCSRSACLASRPSRRISLNRANRRSGTTPARFARLPAPKQKVFDNDNSCPSDTKLSIIGPAAAAEGTPAENSAESTTASSAAGENKAAPSQASSKAPADAKSAADTKAADSKSATEEKAPLKSEAKPDDKAPKSTAKTSGRL